MEDPDDHLRAVPVFGRPRKMTEPDTHFGKNSNLEDMILYFNASARLGRGHLIWCGWNASQWSAGSPKTRNTSPSSGAQCVMVSTQGARFLDDKAEAGEIPDMHMGNFLSTYCGLKW